MVINSHYRFVFVHVPKAAGTSVTSWLSTLRGNCTAWRAATKHETLAEMQDAVGQRAGGGVDGKCAERALRSFFRFGFVRNPWDRMSSLYRYLIEKNPLDRRLPVRSLKDFLKQADEKLEWIDKLHSMKQQVDYFTFAGGEMRLDFLGHFEHLAEDMAQAAARIGYVADRLPHLNQSSNRHRDYRWEFDSDMIERVARRFADDIRFLGYQFDHPHPVQRVSGKIKGERRLVLDSR